MERFAVIGLGRFGRRLASLLADAGAEVIAIDKVKELVDSVRDRVAVAVCMDCSDEQALRAQGVDKVDVAIVGIGTSFEDSALATVVLRQIGVERVISRATSQTRADILSRIGATEIVNPETEAAERWATRLMAPAIRQRLELGEGYSLVQVAAPESFHHKTLRELDTRNQYGVNVVVVHREMPTEPEQRGHPPIISVPTASTVIKPGTNCS